MLTISQPTFAEQLVSEYGVGYGKSVPFPVGTKLAKFGKKKEAPGGWPFRELVGSLMWLATQTRPDISNAVRAVARYCSAPKYVHWKEAMGILRVCETNERIWYYFSERYSRRLSLQAFVC